MKSVSLLVGILLSLTGITHAQSLQPGTWKGALLRQDGNQIVFNFAVSYDKKKPVIHILNAKERLEVRQVKQEKDSLFIEMPFFESAFFLQLQPDGSLKGKWVKGTSGKDIEMPFIALPGVTEKFGNGNASGGGAAAAPVRVTAGGAAAKHVSADKLLTGRWEMTFTKAGKSRPAIAELQQQGSRLTGSISTPTGDYRYLDGIVRGDSLFLSTFDGSHAYVFTAHISDAQTIDGGTFYSGPTYIEQFAGRRNDNATLSMDEVAIHLKPGQERLDFRFPDLDGKTVGINDQRFRGKVVVIQLMGSWCPNCMDETAFLSDYYRRNKDRGIEMVALAYEYSTDLERSKKSLKKFQQRFNVQYPMLITGVKSSDSLRTEKTLPQLTPIKSFPSTIFIGRDGKVKKVHGGFFGPATGELYTQYVKEFEETVDNLLGQ